MCCFCILLATMSFFFSKPLLKCHTCPSEEAWMIEKNHENHPECHCPDPNQVGVWCSDFQKFLSPCKRLGV